MTETKITTQIKAVCFESRYAESMASGIKQFGAEVLSVPTVQEIPLSENARLRAFGERLLSGEVEIMIFITGTGARLMIESLAEQHGLEAVIAAFNRIDVIARGRQSVSVLSEYAIAIATTVSEPSTWREIPEMFDASHVATRLEGRRVGLQEVGGENTLLVKELKRRGATVVSVPVYRLELPQDTTALDQAIDQMIARETDLVFFTNGTQIKHLCRYAAEHGKEQPLKGALRELIIASIGPSTSRAVTDYGVAIDVQASSPQMDILIKETFEQCEGLKAAKGRVGKISVEARSVESEADKQKRIDSPFMKACRLEAAPYTPVWLMRQAGRYMQDYRQLRNRYPFLELCRNKELIAEVTVTAAEKLKVDAAILFSDILLIVEPLGLGLEYVAGDGPVISGEVRCGKDVDRLREVEPEESLSYVFDGVRYTRAALNPAMPLIGFSGAPFTLASYIIEGGGSKAFLNTKRFMYSDSGAWHALMEKISRGVTKYLLGQIAAGADVVQLFDSWVGCLGPEDYRIYVQPHTKSIIDAMPKDVPVIHFGTGTSPFLKDIRDAGGDVIGVDFHTALDTAWETIGYDHAVQGNLDPIALFAPLDEIKSRVRLILDQAGGRPGHIFNLGHGILPKTPEDHVIKLVEMVHEMSS